MKKTMTEEKAAAVVINLIFKEIDEAWPGINKTLHQFLKEQEIALAGQEMAKFNMKIAVFGISAMELSKHFNQEQSKRIIAYSMKFLSTFLGNDELFEYLQKLIQKYMEAFKLGLSNQMDPYISTAQFLYYNMGLKNLQQTINGKSINAPNYMAVDYLSKILKPFTGKWKRLNEQYTLIHAAQKA